MDPDTTLKDLRKLTARILHVQAHGHADTNEAHEQYILHTYALANAFQSLDEWIMKGGFLPEAWDREQRAAKRMARIRREG